jgi:hypothetical protein
MIDHGSACNDGLPIPDNGTYTCHGECVPDDERIRREMRTEALANPPDYSESCSQCAPHGGHMWRYRQSLRIRHDPYTIEPAPGDWHWCPGAEA